MAKTDQFRTRCEACGAAVQGTRLCLGCSPEGTMFKRPLGVKQFVPELPDIEQDHWE